METGAFRIIDANFNRAREACRVMEEFCRFVLNCEPLTAEVKQLRHELCGLIAEIDNGKLLASRDTPGDVGVGQKVDKQMQRTNVQDSFTAACKRLPEALRVLTEIIKCREHTLADNIEQLRYRSYTLEKDITLFSCAAQKYKQVRLYIVITNDKPDEVLELTDQCIVGEADCIQIRAKSMPGDELYETSCEMVKRCRDADVLSIVNDRADIAITSNADGVHLGQNDLPISEARSLAPSPIITGKSTHSMNQLKAAVEEMPTYVGLGPVFPTGTKPDAPPVGLSYVNRATEYLADKGVGHVAIGAIDINNVAQVISAGARAVAVCSAVTHAADPAQTCKALKQKILDSVG